MYGQVKRDEAYVCRLKEFISQAYGVAVKSIAPATRGFYGKTWEIESARSRYFVKLDYSNPHKLMYRDSFQVLERLSLCGIDCVSKVVKTAKDELFTEYDGAVVGMFDWIDGDNIQNESTKLAEYKILSRVYTVPYDGLSIPKCELDTAAVDKLQNLTRRVQERQILTVFSENRGRIEHNAKRLKLFAERCKTISPPLFITHGDAGGNIIVGNKGKHYLVDWDDPVIAPPERDAWFGIHRRWELDAFNADLQSVGIDYKLNTDVLAFYCYHFWFLYLIYYLETYLDIGNPDGKVSDDLRAYFAADFWINDELEFANKL
ncbi:MAG: aminoglycoside phosphotransferase family protein [Oscillospiraceae bacterium]|jgi:hypothetical protein|nr:aminoglycoside phosphotransferase family protein [Oscillospiraceae bacterium]